VRRGIYRTHFVPTDIGGRGGIRTHGTLAGTPVFKTGALNRSATLPAKGLQALSRLKFKNDREQTGAERVSGRIFMFQRSLHALRNPEGVRALATIIGR
jgi:hypothetical protein